MNCRAGASPAGRIGNPERFRDCPTSYDREKSVRAATIFLDSVRGEQSGHLATASFGAMEATIFSKHGSPRNGSHQGISFNWP